MAELAVVVSGLRISAGRRTLVADLSFQVAAGEVVAMVGESGSGKSLTGKAILGLLPSAVTAAGTITLGGQSVLGRSEKQLRPLRGTKAAMVFQEPQSALNPSQTVGRQLREVLRAHRKIGSGAARDAAIELLSSVGMPEPEVRHDWYPHQLSGGQKQRVVIALALAGRPALLIADEPTTALDVTVQAQILDLLRTLKEQRGLGILLITHNLGVVADIADRVVVVRAGEFVEEASVTQLFAAATQPYTRQLLDSAPVIRTTGEQAPVRGTPIVEVRDLTVSYPAGGGRAAFRALDSVSLHVEAGEILGIVGESGSGKTTLGRAVLGLTPDAAAITRRTTKISLVHQDPFASLDPRWALWRSVAEPLRVAGIRDRKRLRSRAIELLEAVRLPAAFAERRPGELSGGQRQRVALARALANEPELMVADEPTSALDVSVQAALLDLFRELQRELGFAAVFITHDLAVVSEIADRVAVLRHGRLLEVGSIGTVFGSPSTEYTRALLAAVSDPRTPRVRGQARP